MHIANVRTVGRWRYSRMPQWVDDGYADYIARDIDLDDALKKMKEGAASSIRSGRACICATTCWSRT